MATVSKDTTKKKKPATKKKTTKKKTTKKKTTKKKTTKKKTTKKKTTKKKTKKKTTKKKTTKKKTTKKKTTKKKTTKKPLAKKKTTTKKTTKTSAKRKTTKTKAKPAKTKTKKKPVKAIKVKLPPLAEVAKKDDNVIYLFASETSQVVVQTKPSLKVTAICPPKERELLVDVKGKVTDNTIKLLLKTPTLAWTKIFTRWKQPHREGYCQCMKCTTNQHQREQSVNYLHTIDMKKCKAGYIHGATYCVGNCDSSHEGGWLCFGGNPHGRSHRQSNRIYWGSVFNNSPGKYQLKATSHKDQNKSLVKHMKAYKAGTRTRTDTRNVPYHNLYDYIFGKEFMASSQATQGLLISFDKQLIKDNPKGVSENQGIKAKGGNIQAIIGLVNRCNGGWLVDLPNGDTLRLSDDQVVVC